MKTRYPHPTSTSITAVMKANKRVDTKPEKLARSILHRKGFRFRKDCRIIFKDGIYNFSARVTLNGLDPTTRYVVALYKNGASVCYLDSGYTDGNDYGQFGGAVDLKLVAGDYVVWSCSDDATTTRYGFGALYTHFSGHRVY